MQTSQLTLNKTHETTAPSITLEAKVSRNRRKILARALLFVAALLALLAGAAGLFSSLRSEEIPARIGEAVEISGGVISVDSVTPEHMAPMKMSKFSAGGMNMSGMGMDMAPEGKRRFTVELTLTAGDTGSLAYSADDFRVSGGGLEDVAPLRHQLETGMLPAGSAVSGTLLFQVPEAAKKLTLSFDDGRQISLDLPPASEDGHSHSGGQERGHDH